MTKWIKYNEENPINGQTVAFLICGHLYPYAGVYNDDKFTDSMGYTYIYPWEITHWLKLPKAPHD